MEEIGQAAAEALRADPLLAATVAEWAYDDVAERWWFVMVTPYVNKRGLKAAYLRVRQVLSNAGLLDKLPLWQVLVADPSELRRTSSSLFRALGLHP